MAQIPVKSKTILIVDDTRENIIVLEAILSREYIVRTATCGSEALASAREVLPDLIMLDIMMPEMNGFDVCRALKADETTKKIPVIFATTLLDPCDETCGFEVGGVDYITKPLNAAVVRSRVKTHLNLKETQDGLEEWNSNLKKRLLQSIRTIRKEVESDTSADTHISRLHGYLQSVELLTGVFGLMDDPFGVSSRAVSELAGDAARTMKMSVEDVAKVRLAGLLHNIGTLGTKRAASTKSESEMTDNALNIFHSHPVLGQELLDSCKDLQDVGLMVRSHHETYNGCGFPDGTGGDDIPLGARLIAIAAFIEHAANSVSTDRDTYALMAVRLHAGTLFDPRLIPFFSMITRILYYDKNKTVSTGEVEVSPKDLFTGMQLSRDLSNEAGVLLMQKDDTLDSAGIEMIRRNIKANAPAGGGRLDVYYDNGIVCISQAELPSVALAYLPLTGAQNNRLVRNSQTILSSQESLRQPTGL